MSLDWMVMIMQLDVMQMLSAGWFDVNWMFWPFADWMLPGCWAHC